MNEKSAFRQLTGAWVHGSECGADEARFVNLSSQATIVVCQQHPATLAPWQYAPEQVGINTSAHRYCTYAGPEHFQPSLRHEG
ncbi:MAG TPA: hypothetical protein VLJ11_03480, partial [Bryobacteraceae bacterium]|nr:hypothetical protein [Bryobacteraceae bacterium]